MTIKLYKISDEPNKIQKTLGTAIDVSGTLRQPSSVESPVVQIQISTRFNCNYAYIQEFNRYYFITDKTMDTNTLMTITLKVDVLMTYATDILYTPMLLERSEVYPENYLTDSQRAILNYPMTLTKKFPSSFDSFHYYLTTAASP